MRPVISASLNSCERAESSHLAGPIPVQRSGKIKNQQSLNRLNQIDACTASLRHGQRATALSEDLKMVGST